jgi:hypothetical protein
MRGDDKPPRPALDERFDEPDALARWMKIALIIAAVFCVVGISVCAVFEGCGKKKTPAATAAASAEPQKPPEPPPDLEHPVRPAPSAFPPDSNLPRGKEIYASGPIDLATFNPTNDLVRFEDDRVWFESDTKRAVDKEDDHLIHKNMAVPLKRLVNLLEKRGGKLKVQDAYRPADKNKIHMAASLHCEGRAIDLTCEKIGLGDLAKLAWQSGFDFVLYEKPVKSGLHLHCSVKRSSDAPLPPRPPVEKK